MKHLHILISIMLGAVLMLTGCQPKSKTDAATAVADSLATEDQNNSKLTDITLPDRNGNDVSLLDEVKKHPFTVIDFWASWCGPCMAEMPNMKALYEEYSDRGLGIIGLSLDKDREAWTQTIDKMGLNWTHLSDLKGWESLAAQTYGIRSIPHMMLVNSDGEILGTDYDSETLKHAVFECINDYEDMQKMEAETEEAPDAVAKD